MTAIFNPVSQSEILVEKKQKYVIANRQKTAIARK
jgi:hypothetical protein